MIPPFFSHIGHWELRENEIALLRGNGFAATTASDHALYLFSKPNPSVPGGQEALYIGKTRMGLTLRLSHYQRAKDGDGRTNGRIRRLIRQVLRGGDTVEVYAFVQNDGLLQWGGFSLSLPAALEDTLIAEIQPPWNGGRVDVEVMNGQDGGGEPPAADQGSAGAGAGGSGAGGGGGGNDDGPEGLDAVPPGGNLAQQSRAALRQRIAQAAAQGQPFVEIRCGDVHNAMGWRTRQRIVSGAMEQLFRLGDTVIGLPNNGVPVQGLTFAEQINGQNPYGANLVIRYRTGVDRGQN
jgi:hypothetical protein